MVGTDGEGCVVQRARCLLDPDRLGAHFDDQGLRCQPQSIRRGHAEARTGQSLQVDLGAGERHHRMQRHRQCADARQWLQHVRSVRPAGVRDHGAGAQHGRCSETAHQVGQHVVRHRDDQQVSDRGHLVGRHHRCFWDEVLRPTPALPRHGADTDQAMARALQRSTEHSTDAAGADHADSKAGRPVGRRDVRHERSSPLGVPDICHATGS